MLTQCSSWEELELERSHSEFFSLGNLKLFLASNVQDPSDSMGLRIAGQLSSLYLGWPVISSRVGVCAPCQKQVVLIPCKFLRDYLYRVNES